MLRLSKLPLLFAVAAALIACGGDPNGQDGSMGDTGGSVNPDAREAGGMVGPDAGPDIGPDIDPPDIIVEDIVPDEPAPDVQPDVRPDVQPDVVEAGPDVAPDAPAPDVVIPPDNGPPCGMGRVMCGANCVDTQTDIANCGSCGVACPSNNVCRAGRCELICPTGQVACGGTCVDTLSNTAHCGMCGNACPTGQVCNNGTCACPMGQTLCGGRCIDANSDNANCGRCGNACMGGSSCVRGMCACPTGEILCGGRCINPASDLANCGMCSNACTSGQVCSGGMCAPVCNAPRMLCSGVCADTSSDNDHCGRCGNACPTGQSCMGGRCVCPTGLMACGTTCTNTQSDLNNCGMCGTQCAVTANAQAAQCTSGNCILLCRTNYGNCDGNNANGCEIDVTLNANNCGRCGNACPALFACRSSVCIGPPASITINGGATQNTIVNTSFANPLSVIVRDSLGNALSGITVTFTAPAGAVPSAVFGSTGGMRTITATTNGAGIATTPSVFANCSIGAFNVVASATGTAGTVMTNIGLTNLIGPAATITPFAPATAMQSTTVNTNFTSVAVRVADACGNPISGQLVTWTAPNAPNAPTGSFNRMNTATAMTNAMGVAVPSNPLQASTRAGIWTLPATIASPMIMGTFTLTNTPGPAFGIQPVAGSTPQNVVVGQATPNRLAVQVVDSFGNAVPQAGVTVTFTSDPMSPTGNFAGGGSTGVTAVTNGMGVATPPIFTADTFAGGPYNVSAMGVIGTAQSTATFSLTNVADRPVRISFGEPSTFYCDGETGEFYIYVYDQYDNNVPNVTVRFRAPAMMPSGYWDWPPGVNSVTAVSNAFGEAVSPTGTAHNTSTGRTTVTITFDVPAFPAVMPITLDLDIANALQCGAR